MLFVSWFHGVAMAYRHSVTLHNKHRSSRSAQPGPSSCTLEQPLNQEKNNILH